MSKTQNVGTTNQDKKYVVNATGYKETFASLEEAKKQYDILKKRTIKSQESTKLELTEVDANGKKKVLENVSIGEDFYN